MNVRKVLLLAVVVIFPWTVAAEAQKDDAAKDEMKKLQGVWQVTKWIGSEGGTAPADEIENLTFEFKEDRVTQRKGKDRTPIQGKYSLDPSKKPKWLDINFGQVTEAIYKLEGDELTFCVISGSRSGQPSVRPTEFKASKEKHHTLFVLKKVKK